MIENKKISPSIVFKLNTWHLSQVFLGFLWINLLFILLFLISQIYQAETLAITQTIPIDMSVGEPNGFIFPEPLQSLLSKQTKDAKRQFIANWDNKNFFLLVSSIKYRIWMPDTYDKKYNVFEYPMGNYLTIFIKLFLAISVIELLFLLSSIGNGAKAIRAALRPIWELTQTAKSLNTSQPVKPNEQIRDLTGTIDTINATDLGRRISISSAQNELKDLAGAINAMLDRINESYRSQIRFVSDASHELRTPIAVIQGYANLLDRWGKYDENALQESIQAIKSEADGMKDLVEQLLFLARGDNDSMRISMEEIDLSSLISEIVRETTMIDKNHTITSNIVSGIKVIGDAQLFKQAIRIFLDNSMKYTPIGESIEVSAVLQGEFAKIIIQDNGIGIPAEDLPYVFDRFYRSDDSRTRKTGGTGLGLSIAKWIIDKHNAHTQILSRKDLGTKITITLAGFETLENL